MQKEDTLDNCLIALGQQYPESPVEVNTAILRVQNIHIPDCTLSELRKLVQVNAPDWLEQTAHVLEDGKTGEIFLLKIAEEASVFRYHV